MEREYKRPFLLENNMMPEDTWVSLRYGLHSSGRNEERKVGSLDVLPQRVKCGKDNIRSLYLNDDMSTKKMIVRLNYSRTKWLFLVIVDGYFVKTVWWRDKHNRYGSKNMGRQTRLAGMGELDSSETLTANREFSCELA